MSPLIAYPIPSDDPPNHVHANNTKWTQEIVFIYSCVCAYVCVFVTVTIKEEEARKLRGSGKDI